MKKQKIARLLMLVVVVFVVIFCLVGPFAWLVNASFQKRVELFSQPPTWLPESLYLENFRVVLTDVSMLKSLRNSALISSAVTASALAIGSLGAYAFARMQFKGRRVLFLGILATQMLPAVAVLIPLYVTMRKLNLVYTYQGLILADLSFSLPYVVWLLRSYFVSIPKEVEEAALVDGCSTVGAIIRVVLPLSAPGYVVTAVFAFLASWNEFMMASVFTNDTTKTFTVKVAQYMGEEATAYEHMFAASVVGTLPILLLIIVLQRWIVRGLTQGGVKL